MCRSGPTLNMIPTLKTRNTRICILLGQKNQRMGMLTLHDAERLQAQSLTFTHDHSTAACFLLSHMPAYMHVFCSGHVSQLRLVGSCLQGLHPGTTAGCYPIMPSGVNSCPPKDADATKGEVSLKLLDGHTLLCQHRCRNLSPTSMPDAADSPACNKRMRGPAVMIQTAAWCCTMTDFKHWT